jgi:hypothetical protein
MSVRRGWIPALLLLTSMLAASPAHASTADGPRCHMEFEQGKMHYKPDRAEFIVHSPGPRGAMGVWKNGSGDRLRVRVDPGEGEASKTLLDVSRREYELVRCATVR